MNPLDAINPDISDEELARDYAESMTDLVTPDYPLSAVRKDDQREAHRFFSELLRTIFGCKCEDLILCDCLSSTDLAVRRVKRIRADMAYVASLLTCRMNGDGISLSVIREGALASIGMTWEEAMATTDLWGEEE